MNNCYCVYPKNMKLEWSFMPESCAEISRIKNHASNQLNPKYVSFFSICLFIYFLFSFMINQNVDIKCLLIFQIIFNDRIVDLDSDYRTNSNIDPSRLFILDVYKLASHFMKRDDAIKLSLKEIIAKV